MYWVGLLPICVLLLAPAQSDHNSNQAIDLRDSLASPAELGLIGMDHSGELIREMRHKRPRRPSVCCRPKKIRKKIRKRLPKPRPIIHVVAPAPQPVLPPKRTLFTDADRNQTMYAIMQLKPDHSLANFSKIFDSIMNATGLVPPDIVPILRNLSISFSTTTKALKVGLAESCSVLTKFILKSYHVIQRGMDENDERVLLQIVAELKTDTVRKLEVFIETARTELLEIYTYLLKKTHGSRITRLLERREKLETTLLNQSRLLTRKSTEWGANQGKIEAFRYEKKVFKMAQQDSTKARDDVRKTLRALRGKIAEYQDKILENRDFYGEERTYLWIFIWKVRDLYVDNGEKIARENLERLLDRIRALEEVEKNWLNLDLIQRITAATVNLTTFEAKKVPLEREYKQLNSSFERTKKDFDSIIKDIDHIYRSTGTTNLASLTVVDQLARTVYSGEQAIVAAYAKLRGHFEAISVDKDLLVSSVRDALKFINMVDPYIGETRINGLRQSLGLN